MSDIVFDDGEQVSVLCDNLRDFRGASSVDDVSWRRGGGPTGPRFRRALVHDTNDGLTMNFGDDYPGGVTINGVHTLDVVGDLTFRISHHDEVTQAGGSPPSETVTLSDVIKTLRQEIAGLKSQVAQLQRP